MRNVDAVYLMRPWAKEGGDCRTPAFRIDQDTTGGLVVETKLNGRHREGVVLQGQYPALRFGKLKLPLERRGVDGLAVMPPANAQAVSLGAAAIAGGGAVFVRCPEMEP